MERCEGAGCTNFVEIATTLGTDTTFSDTTGLVASTSYSYQVRAADAVPNLGSYSNVAVATTPTPDTEAPTAPSNLIATAVSGSQINLSWTAATDNVGVTGYRVERCLGAGCATFLQIGTAPGTATTYNDTTVLGSTTYGYRVRATDVVPNLGPYSTNVASATSLTPSNVIALSMVPSRTSGVAPLSVHFDATGTTDAAVTSRPFHNLQYSWDFGDSVCVAGQGAVPGTWDYGSRAGVSSRNTATGPLASHMFECAGTFTVTLTVFDGTNTSVTTRSVTVTSADSAYPGTSTICYRHQADDGTFTGCPTGATQATQSNCSAIASAATAGTRTLFRRGDTWTSCSLLFNATGGHGLVGAFGPGAKPILRVGSGISTGLVISTCSTPSMSDWRFMDLDIDGVNGAAGSQGIVFNGGADYITLLRMTVRNTNDTAILAIDPYMSSCIGQNPANHIWQYTAIVDSTVTNTAGTPLLWDSYHFTLQGNNLNGAGSGGHGDHTIRTGLQQNSVLSNNSVSNSASAIWTIRAPDFINATAAIQAGTYTQNVVFSDNKLFGATATLAVVFTIRPTNTTRDERLRNIIVERNWILTGANSSTGMQINAQYVTVRNNLFDVSLGGGHVGVGVGRTGIEPGPIGIRLYNNSFYSGSTGGFAIANVNPGISTAPAGLTVVNNLAYAPNASGPVLFNNSCGPSCISQSNNTATLTTSPLLTNTATNNWKPQAGSNAIGAGALVPVWSDFFGVTEPSPRDIGAVAH